MAAFWWDHKTYKLKTDKYIPDVYTDLVYDSNGLKAVKGVDKDSISRKGKNGPAHAIVDGFTTLVLCLPQAVGTTTTPSSIWIIVAAYGDGTAAQVEKACTRVVNQIVGLSSDPKASFNS